VGVDSVKIQLGPTDIIFPVPAALVVSGSGDKINVLTVAWIGMVSSNPPILAISLNKRRYSLTLIRESGQFTVNIPSSNMFREVDYCGLVSGKSENKFEKVGFTLLSSSIINTPIIKECPYNIECKVIRKATFGEWVAVFGEIVETHVDKDKISSAGKVDVARIDPLVYCATIREYWSIGKKLGNGFNAGSKYRKCLFWRN
jgi:flavin reductase (DIM6/NTAB) family NADH-FMN oxidoreductase RutF